MPKLKIDVNLHDVMLSSMHGRHSPKSLVVLHETVSGDQRGLDDIINVANYLDRIGYGIHGMTDKEAHLGWAKNLGTGIFYHCGGVNSESIGIEQVFKGATNNPRDQLLWVARQAQLRAVAKLLACIHRAHPHIPLKFSDSTTPGITSHWNVSQFHKESEGHWDCHPIHLGGYYPMLKVIQLARNYHRLGYHF